HRFERLGQGAFVVEVEGFSDDPEVVRAGQMVAENGFRVAIQRGRVQRIDAMRGAFGQYRVHLGGRRSARRVGDAVVEAELDGAQAEFHRKASSSAATTSSCSVSVRSGNI